MESCEKSDPNPYWCEQAKKNQERFGCIGLFLSTIAVGMITAYIESHIAGVSVVR